MLCYFSNALWLYVLVFVRSLARHHCRRCGQNVCHNCASQTRRVTPVPGAAETEIGEYRTCNKCVVEFDKIVQKNKDEAYVLFLLFETYLQYVYVGYCVFP